MPDKAPVPLPALSALRGAQAYVDVSELPRCVSVRVWVQIYSDDVPADWKRRPQRPAPPGSDLQAAPPGGAGRARR